MNLIYSHNYANARTFALHHDLMPGDWTWISDPGVIRRHARADVYKAPGWDGHPRHDDIDAALQRAIKAHRLGTLNDFSTGGGNSLGVSSG